MFFPVYCKCGPQFLLTTNEEIDTDTSSIGQKIGKFIMDEQIRQMYNCKYLISKHGPEFMIAYPYFMLDRRILEFPNIK